MSALPFSRSRIPAAGFTVERAHCGESHWAALQRGMVFFSTLVVLVMVLLNV